MKSCCCELDDVAYYQGQTKSGEKWTPAFIEYVDKEKCNGCGLCVKVCSRGVYEIQELNGRKISVAECDGVHTKENNIISEYRNEVITWKIMI